MPGITLPVFEGVVSRAVVHRRRLEVDLDSLSIQVMRPMMTRGRQTFTPVATIAATTRCQVSTLSQLTVPGMLTFASSQYVKGSLVGQLGP